MSERKRHEDHEIHSEIALWDQAAIIDRLVLLSRQRRQILRARTRLSNQLDAQERLITGKVKGGKAAKNRFTVSPIARAAAEKVTPVLAEHLKSLHDSQKPYDKEIAALAERLAVWVEWGRAVRGFGPLLLGLLIGETGDLFGYANPAKVWKRMGVAVMPDGTRQRRVKGDEAIAHGYVAERRSLVWNIGDCLIKLNADGPYRRLYDERKAVELVRLDNPENIAQQKAHARQGKYSPKAHAHARASRYMQKRFLVDLWRVWNRQASIALRPFAGVPAAPDDQARESLKPRTDMPDRQELITTGGN